MHLLKKMLCVCFPLLFMAAIHMSAQERNTQNKEGNPSWYIGLQGGVPFGISTFSSFGADKTRAGFDAGLYGGYRFNPVLSLEAQAAWGRVNQSAQDCCAGYWLGADGHRYEAAVAGMDGWRYADLKSGTFTQRYGLQLNVNLLGFFLGYPYEDVMGFITHRGRDFICFGCWKVYANPRRALRSFSRFKRCARRAERLRSSGATLADLARPITPPVTGPPRGQTIRERTGT